MPADLAALARAAAAKRRADEQYRAALLAAVEQLERDGARNAYAQVAAALDTSRQAVRQLVERARAEAGTGEQTLERRLAELDARYDRLVDALAARETPDLEVRRRDQARKNGQARKRARKGLGRLPTVREEVRAFAEAKLLRLLEDRRGEALVDRVVAELDEAALLREQLAALRDSRRGF